MEITETGVPLENLVDAVKSAVREAGISAADADRPLRITAVQLALNAIATTSGGVKIEFKIPFIGMPVKLGRTVTAKDTHTVDITLVPPDLAPQHEVRGGDVDRLLVEAIEAVAGVVRHARGGEDPFLLKESTVELTFAVTDDGTISLGLDGHGTDELTHKLKITLAAQG